MSRSRRLEEFLIARANAPAPADGADGARTSIQLDAAAAQTALNAPGINRSTGERVGGKAYEISPDVLAEDEAEAFASGSASGSNRGWYGWGGKADPKTTT